MAERFRDLNQPIDVVLLDATVSAFYGTGSKEEVSPLAASGILFVLPCLFFSLIFLSG